jgi:uncharacterized protein (TIGR03067 family)
MNRFALAGGLMAVAVAGLALADEKALKELEGTYKVTALEKGGKAAPDELTKGLTVTFKGDEFLLNVMGEEKKAKVKVDASKTPRTIDIVPGDGESKGKTFPGIYKVEKGEVTIAFTEEGDRPKEFKSEGQTVLLTMKKDEKDKK